MLFLSSWSVVNSNTPVTQSLPFPITRLARSPPISDSPRFLDQTVLEIPVNNVQTSTDNKHDRIQVVSSAIRVLPREKKRFKRAEQQWRTPKMHKFVTAKVEKVDPPSVIRVYPLDRSQRYLNTNDYYNYRRNPPRRRIIYYATLPEIIHPPQPWQSSQTDRMYLPPNEITRLPPRTNDITRLPPRINEITRLPPRMNEIPRLPPRGNEITRVQSNLIDVLNTRNTPKYTIIDVEPPYNYATNSDQDRYYNDIRTPPYRHHYMNPVRPSYIPEENLKPVKLQIPNSVNGTDSVNNSTRLLPDDLARFV